MQTVVKGASAEETSYLHFGWEEKRFLGVTGLSFTHYDNAPKPELCYCAGDRTAVAVTKQTGLNNGVRYIKTGCRSITHFGTCPVILGAGHKSPKMPILVTIFDWSRLGTPAPTAYFVCRFLLPAPSILSVNALNFAGVHASRQHGDAPTSS